MQHAQPLEGLTQRHTAGQHHQEHQAGGDMVGLGCHHPRDRIHDPVQPEHDQPDEGDRGDGNEGPVRHRRPAEAEQTVFIEGNVGRGKEQNDEQSDVEQIARHRAHPDAGLHSTQRDEARHDRMHPAGERGAALAAQVGVARHGEQTDQPP